MEALGFGQCELIKIEGTLIASGGALKKSIGLIPLMDTVYLKFTNKQDKK